METAEDMTASALSVGSSRATGRARSRSGGRSNSTRGLCAHRGERIGDHAVGAAGVPLGEAVERECGAGRAGCGSWPRSSPSGVMPMETPQGRRV